MAETIKGGLIGCGDISADHLRAYAHAGIELAALCDQDPARAERRKAEFGTPATRVFTRHQDLLALPEIDFVSVATPVATHAPLTLDALDAGKHVACEKPSTLSLSENEAIVHKARQAGKIVFFFSGSMRWGAATLARHAIDRGDLGEIYRVNVQYYRRRGRPGIDIVTDAHWFHNSALAGGGIIMDMGQYFMDMVLNLAGWPPITAVSATAFRGFPHPLPPGSIYDVEEHCTLLARTEGSLTFTFDLASIVHHSPVTRISLLGTRGGILMDDADYFTFFSDQGEPWHWMDQVSRWRDNQSGRQHIYRQFAQAIRGEGPAPGTTPDEAAAITELTQMALLSARLGREVTPALLRSAPS